MARKTLLTEAELRRFMKLARVTPATTNRLSEMGYGMDTVPGARDEDDELESELHATEDELGSEDELADEEGDELDMDADEGGGEMVSLDDFVAALEQAVEEVTGQPTTAELEPEGEEEVDVEAELDMGGVEIDVGAEEEEEIPLQEDQPYTAKKEKPGEDLRKGAEKRGAEGTKKKTSGKGRGEKEGDDAYVNERGLTEDSGEEEGEHYERNRDSDDAHISAIEHHLDALKHDRDYDDEHVRESSREDEIVNEVSRRVAARLAKKAQKDQMAEQLAERILQRLTK